MAMGYEPSIRFDGERERSVLGADRVRNGRVALQDKEIRPTYEHNPSKQCSIL